LLAIQPCALLLLIGPDWRVEAVSANAGELGKGEAESLLGQPLTELIDEDSIHALRNRMAWLSGEDSLVRDYGVSWGGTLYDVHARRQGGCYLIEAESAVEPRLPDSIGMAQSLLDRIAATDFLAIAEQGLRQLRALTGFDRLILCDRADNILGTSERGAMALLIDHWEGSPDCIVPRLIADRDAKDHALLGSEGNASLRRSAFIAPDFEERDRLSALGIAATMSLPLRIDGERVGAIHAHHPTPRRNGAERRAVAELFAERLAARMTRAGWRP
jgi:light-regulated signal transduction histidine kinase (bacteriophytochrome)